MGPGFKGGVVGEMEWDRPGSPGSLLWGTWQDRQLKISEG